METQTNTRQDKNIYDYEIFKPVDYRGFGVLKWVRVYRKDKTFYHMKKSIRYFKTLLEAEQYKKNKEVYKE